MERNKINRVAAPYLDRFKAKSPALYFAISAFLVGGIAFLEYGDTVGWLTHPAYNGIRYALTAIWGLLGYRTYKYKNKQ